MKKSQQQKKKAAGFEKIRCVNFDEQPRFIRAGLHNAIRYRSVRNQGFFQRYVLAMMLKERGNRLFKLGHYCIAINEYEQSLSVFNYFEKVHYANAVEDDLYQVSYVGESDREIDLLQDLRLKIYMNLAACYLKQNYSEDVVKSCDFALKIDSSQVKAYYRRARARNPCDINFAVEDLLKAAQLAPNDNDIKQELQRVVNVGRFQNKQIVIAKPPLQLVKEENQLFKVCASPRSLSPTTSNSSSCDLESTQMTNEEATEFWQQFNINKDYENFNYELSYEEDPNTPIPEEVHELGHFIEFRGVQMLKVFESQGRVKEAELLREKLKKALAAKSQLEKISRLDFSRPKPHLQEIASRFGIDLLENQVQSEFKRIQHQNILDIKNWLQSNQWKSIQSNPTQKKLKYRNKQKFVTIKTQKHQPQPKSQEPETPLSNLQVLQKITSKSYQPCPHEYPQDQIQGQGGQTHTIEDSIITHRVDLQESEGETVLLDQSKTVKQYSKTYWSPLMQKAFLFNALAITGILIYKVFEQ